MTIRGFLVLSFLLLFSGVAQASQWIVERATKGVAMSADGSSWSTVRAGDAVPNSYWLRTGPKARVLLAKGAERIIYRENTLAAISVSEPSGRKTKVTQSRGSVLLSVEKRRTQHTSVVTPHLAAVVKGTVFEVTASREHSSVRVDRGLVAVSDGHRTVGVRPGLAAKVGHGTKSIHVTKTSKTSLNADGKVGLRLTEVKSGGSSDGNGHDSSDGNGHSSSDGNGHGSSGGNGHGGGENDNAGK